MHQISDLKTLRAEDKEKSIKEREVELENQSKEFKENLVNILLLQNYGYKNLSHSIIYEYRYDRINEISGNLSIPLAGSINQSTPLYIEQVAQ